MKIHKGDKVVVIKGKYKGEVSKVIKVFRKDNSVLLQGINIVKKHVKVPTLEDTPKKEPKIVKIERPIDVSKVMLICPNCTKPTRVGFKIIQDQGKTKKIRICKKCNQEIKNQEK
ncbi:MAG: 50S ribosomal protein L24 [bacterium]|nr:50S ribosomal protein L24 [bacterium]